MYTSRTLFLGTIVCLAAAIPVRAADGPTWQPMLGDLVKTEKAGFGGLCGMSIDHATGTILINISDRGFYRSTDGGRTFQRLSGTQPRGRTEEPGCFLIDPTGRTKRLVTALVYGAPICVSDDGGAAWRMMDGKSSHIDWCAVDWTDPDMKFVLALKHEAGGLLIASRDGGKSFTEIGKGYGTGWVFNNTTAVVAQAKTKDRPMPNLMRTTDGGQTWQPCTAYSPVGVNSAQALPRWHKDGMLFWLVDGALIASPDKGATWKRVCALKDGRYGPVFGQDRQHMFVLTGAGIIETTDGGANWSKPIAPPKDLKGVGGLTWLEYDPKSDSLYLMKMGSELFKLARGK
jgi:photosystem II stability/assembly factor-like uncharacterized protein